MMPRVGVLSLWHETNTYSRRLATLDAWRDYELLAGDAIAAGHRGTRSVVGGFLEALGARAVPIFAAGAWPSGATPRADFALLLEQFEEQLETVGELDGLAVNLHGAMVAEGSDDVEAEFVSRLRGRFGDIPIAAVLDLHGNPSVELANAVDILIAYRTYPHVDMWECGSQAAELLLRMIDGARLSTAIAKIPLLTAPLAQGTDGTMGVVLRSLETAAAAVGLERVSVLPGFAYQDVARAGMSVLVVHDDEHADTARRLASDTAAALQATADRGGFALIRPDAATAVQQAMASTDTPVLLADIADNIGAGSAGDGTVLLSELLRAGATDAVVVIADAEVVRAAAAAGVGARIDTLLGGKTDTLHGPPVPIVGEVRSIWPGTYTTAGSWATGQTFEMGPTAVLQVAGVTIVVTTHATPPFHREHITSVGIDPAEQRIIVAKGAIAWRSAFGDDAGLVIEVDAPGACPIDPWSLPRTTTPSGSVAN